MKKGLKILGFAVAAIVILLLVLPFAFKGNIETLVKKEANSMLNAKFDFSSVSLSFFRHFPQASVDINDVSVIGIERFGQDTLIYASKVRAAVDIFSLFGSKGIHVTEILIDKPYIQGIVADSIHTNWDIVKPSAESSTASGQEKETSEFRLKLDRFSINHGRISYDDVPGNIKASLSDFNMSVKGDMSADHTILKSEISVASVNLRADKMDYLKQASVKSVIDVDADMKNRMFVFRQNSISLNAITTSIDGWVSLPDSSVMDMDVKFNTSKINFKDILSLVPAIYQKDFEGLQASGDVMLNAWARGELKKDVLPAFEADLKVENGMFKYASVPGSVTDIQVLASVVSKGGSIDQVQAKLSNFSLQMAGNPVQVSATATNFISDLTFSAQAVGKVDLSKIATVYPLGDSITLKGIIVADAMVSGTISQIEKEQYEQIKASGSVGVSGFDLKHSSSDLEIKKALMVFSPKFVALEDFQAKMGRNDISMNGRLENFISYALKGKTLKGSLNVASTYLNVADFISETAQPSSDSTAVAVVDTTKAGVVVVPNNLDLSLKVDMKQIVYGKIILSNMVGKASVKNGVARMDGLQFNAFDGKITASGAYDTSVEKSPTGDFRFKVSDASFAKTFSSVESLQKMAPVFEKMSGKYDMELNVTTMMLADFAPDLNSVNGSGSLSSKDVKIAGVPALDKLADAISRPDLKSIEPGNLNIHFTIANGKIETRPFDVKLKDVTLELGGTTGLDQSINYSGKVKLEKGISLFGINIKSVPFTITGSFNSPKVSVDTKASSESALEQAAGKLLDKLGNTDSTSDVKNEEAVDKAVDAIKNIFKKK